MTNLLCTFCCSSQPVVMVAQNIKGGFAFNGNITSSSSSSSSSSSLTKGAPTGLGIFGAPMTNSTRSTSTCTSRVCGNNNNTNNNNNNRMVVVVVRASMVDSHESSSDFVRRMEQAWLISQQPRPIVCSSCDSKGQIECKWCAGTGFFILGDNMLCQVPSRNTTCVICAGQGSMRCSDCKGTGFRARWLGEPPVTK